MQEVGDPFFQYYFVLHIIPEWYFLAYYALLKGDPSKTGGLLVLMSSLTNLALLSEIRALNTRMLIQQHFMTRNVLSGWVTIGVYSMIFLIIIGSTIPQATCIFYGRLATIVYLTTGLILCLYQINSFSDYSFQANMITILLKSNTFSCLKQVVFSILGTIMSLFIRFKFIQFRIADHLYRDDGYL
ncbi:cytochrome b [Besnoitia besnoiti]|uniref:Cytochrome b n=1 Tax=Besnoitia besnoiti TaxID=94643 RepID=A0A2A9MBH0_BESBE|nr:cytochrome b [Besnoitia besnoiti]PFH35315.1 cytochrome b [Besnoitia besnoiti]